MSSRLLKEDDVIRALHEQISLKAHCEQIVQDADLSARMTQNFLVRIALGRAKITTMRNRRKGASR